MPNATNILVKNDVDGTDITLVPISSYSTGPGNLTCVWRELSVSKPEMALTRVTVSSEKLKSGVTKVTRKIEVPIMEIIPAGAVNANGVVASAEVSHYETDIRTRFHHPRSTATERGISLRISNHFDIGARDTTAGGITPSGTGANTYRDAAVTNPFPYGDVNGVWPSA